MKTGTDCGAGVEYEPVLFGEHEIFPAPFCDACRNRRDAALALQQSRDRLATRQEIWADICPPLYRDTNADGPRLPSAVRERLSGWTGKDGNGIGICESTGTGKTRLSYWKLRQLHFGGVKLYAVSAKRLEKMVPASFSDDPAARWEAQDVLNTVRDAQVLLLDDLGNEKYAERVASELYDLVEHRTSHLKPIMWTANTSKADLAARLGNEHADPIMRRLLEFSEIVLT